MRAQEAQLLFDVLPVGVVAENGKLADELPARVELRADGCDQVAALPVRTDDVYLDRAFLPGCKRAGTHLQVPELPGFNKLVQVAVKKTASRYAEDRLCRQVRERE